MTDRKHPSSKGKDRNDNLPWSSVSLHQEINPQWDRRRNKDKSESNKKDSWPKWNAISTTAATVGIMCFTAAAVGVGVYQWRALSSTDSATHDLAAAALKQATAADKQASVMQKQLEAMKAEQRPDIGLLNRFGQPYPDIKPPATRGPITWNLPFTNTGKSTAYHFKVLRFVNFGRLEPSDDSPSEMPPGEGIEMPQNAKMYVTVHSPFFVTQDEFDEIMKINFSIIALLKFEYFDIFGTKYTSEVCVSHFASGAMPYMYPDACKQSH